MTDLNDWPPVARPGGGITYAHTKESTVSNIDDHDDRHHGQEYDLDDPASVIAELRATVDDTAPHPVGEPVTAPTETAETVTVPRSVVMELIGTILRSAIRQPGTREAIDALQWIIRVPVPAGPDDPWTLPADVARCLYAESDALFEYQLNEVAEDAYRHPAVVAEQVMWEAIEDQAPETYRAMTADIDALVEQHRTT